MGHWGCCGAQDELWCGGQPQDSQNISSMCQGCAGRVLSLFHPSSPSNPSTAKALPFLELPIPLKALSSRTHPWMSWPQEAAGMELEHQCLQPLLFPWLYSLDLSRAEGEQGSVTQVFFPMSHPILPLLQHIPDPTSPSQPTQPPPLAFPLQEEHLNPSA